MQFFFQVLLVVVVIQLACISDYLRAILEVQLLKTKPSNMPYPSKIYKEILLMVIVAIIIVAAFNFLLKIF
jgi:uncharacterized membrane protein affecting hemolysin expression